jgi:putative ABC transport system substrate-binding protein
VAIEYRYAEGQYDRLAAMATDLTHRQVAAIVASATPAALAAKSATATVPIVFAVPDDPVKLGLVASLPRPGGNATGLSFFLSELGAKQLGLLHELLPSATHFGLLVNPGNENAETVTRDMKAAASLIGVEIAVVQASDSREIEAAFVTLVRSKADALVVGTDPFFYTRRVQLVTLATRHALPTVFNVREYAEAGGLMSYGTSLAEVFRLTGVYTGRILKGEKPADLPVMQSTKFDFVINLTTAKARDPWASPLHVPESAVVLGSAPGDGARRHRRRVGAADIQRRMPNLPYDQRRRQSSGSEPTQHYRKEGRIAAELRLVQRYEGRGVRVGQRKAGQLYRETR